MKRINIEFTVSYELGEVISEYAEKKGITFDSAVEDLLTQALETRNDPPE